MKIIITDTFKSDFDSLIFQKGGIEVFLLNLKKDENKFIKLSKEYDKFRFYVFNNSLRGIIYTLVSGVLIPIFIVKKSDKKYGMNLTLTKDLLKILDIKTQKMIIDFRAKCFVEYEVDDNGNINQK